MALRLLLIAKAKRGKWDPRMCTLHGKSANLNRGCRRAIVRGYARGLVPSSTLRTPVCQTCSFHQRRNRRGRGKGVDQAAPMTERGKRKMRRYQRREFEAWQRGNRPNMVELIGPLNDLIVLSGRHVPLREGAFLEDQHDNHVHQAFDA